MKKLLAFFIVIGSSLGVYAQQPGNQLPKLSAFTRQYLNQLQQAGNKNQLVPHYVYKNINNQQYISAFIKVNGDINQAQLDSMGIFIGTKAGTIWTAQIPVAQLTAFTHLQGISYIDLDAPIISVAGLCTQRNQG